MEVFNPAVSEKERANRQTLENAAKDLATLCAQDGTIATLYQSMLVANGVVHLLFKAVCARIKGEWDVTNYDTVCRVLAMSAASQSENLANHPQALLAMLVADILPVVDKLAEPSRRKDESVSGSDDGEEIGVEHVCESAGGDTLDEAGECSERDSTETGGAGAGS